MVNFLIEHGAKVTPNDSSQMTPLHIAAMRGNSIQNKHLGTFL